MKASFQWLRSLVPQIPNDPTGFAARITAAGLEVEGSTQYGDGAEQCEIVAVVSMRPHPSKSGLRLVTVDRGNGVSLEVICGAPNVPDPGGLVVLAPLGAKLPAKGMTIERRTIAGVVSEGMLCSESELGLTEEGGGILVLPPGTGAPGTRFIDAVPSAHDVIFDIGLTPNRPDCLGHIGLAREAAALFGIPWSPPPPEPPARTQAGAVSSFVRVTIQEPERCPHYGAAIVTGVTTAPSPLGVRYRLAALGVRPISNLVDISNLVMLEYGHPLHAFDLDRVKDAHITVRRARAGEKVLTLDGVTRALDEDDLVICDGAGPVALAGVMGGGDSEISPTTTRVLVECAYFDPRSVRRAGRRHALHTEASYRFERGVDHGDTSDVLAQAVGLATRLAGGTAVPGVLLTAARPLERFSVTLDGARMNRLLGVDVPFDEAIGILRRLGFEVRASADARTAECLVPTHRPDVAREVDLIDEVARVRGLDKIPAVLPAIRPTREVGHQEALAKRARAAGVALGLAEAVTFGFVSRRELEAVGAPEPTVVLRNPLTEMQAVMRTSLLPGVLEVVARARRHGERDVGVFTVGRVFLAGEKGGLPAEPTRFAAVLAGERTAYLAKPAPVDVWHGKGLAVAMVQRFVARAGGASVSVRALSDARGDRPKHLHPRGAAAVEVDGNLVATFGLLHPDVVDALDVGGEVVIVEIDIERLHALATRGTRYAAIPRFPPSTRDAAWVVSDKVAAGEVEAAVRSAAGPLAERVELFDKFVGGAVPPDHASLAFRVVYRAADRTLTDAEVDAQHERVTQEVGARFGATLRA